MAENSSEKKLVYFGFSSEQWTHIHANNVIERMNREICHHVCVVGSFSEVATLSSC